MKVIAASAAVTATAVGLLLLTVVIDAYLPVDRLSDLLTNGLGGAVGQQEASDDGDNLHQSIEALEPSAVIKQRRRLASAAEQVKNQLAAERTTVANLTSTLASSERAAAATIAMLQEQLQRERSRSATTLEDLAQARGQIARTFHDRVVRIEHQVAEDDRLLTDLIRRAADPAAGTMLPLAVQLSSRPSSIDVPGAGVERSAPPAPELQHGASLGGSVVASASMSAAGDVTDAALPVGVETRVTLKYALGSEAARRRAVALSQALQARGINAAEPVDAPAAIANGRVTYFYQIDRASAEHVAALAIASPPIRGRLPANGRIPRPGTIEITIDD